MCTLVCRWHAEDAFAVHMLALRDELASRPFDEPGAWWPDQPGVIGGRDRTAGGSWCVSDVATGTTAVVLNRPERPQAGPGASSRGVLPLQAVRHGQDWPEHLDVSDMASFNLVLAGPDALSWWWFDGQRLEQSTLSAGTWMFTPEGLATTAMDERLLSGGARLGPDPSAGTTEQVWESWVDVVRTTAPSADPTELLVRRAHGEDSYETVFGQLIAARAGLLRIDYLDHPARDAAKDWTTTMWQADSAV